MRSLWELACSLATGAAKQRKTRSAHRMMLPSRPLLRPPVRPLALEVRLTFALVIASPTPYGVPRSPWPLCERPRVPVPTRVGRSLRLSWSARGGATQLRPISANKGAAGVRMQRRPSTQRAKVGPRATEPLRAFGDSPLRQDPCRVTRPRRTHRRLTAALRPQALRHPPRCHPLHQPLHQPASARLPWRRAFRPR